MSAAAFGQAASFTYQGQLKDGGVPADGSYNLVFKLFNAAGGGAQVGSTITRNGVVITNGLFTQTLDFGAAAFNGQPRWLEITVNGEVLSRQPLTATPYALYALSGPAGSGPWQTSGLNIFNSNTGNVGIGTNDATHRLTVAASTQETMRLFRSGAGVGDGARLNFGDADYVFIEEDVDDALRIQADRIALSGGNVGIGTTEPQADLDVRGDLVLAPGESPVLYTGTTAAESNRYLFLINSPTYTSASGLKAGGVLVADSYSFANPGKNDLIVKGNVGVGTANPGARLEVAGGEVRLPGGTNSANYGTHFNYSGDGRNYIRGATIIADTSGNVGIGTSTPNAATRLNVFTNVAGQQAVRGDSPNGNGVVGTSAVSGYGAAAGVNSASGGIGVYGEAHAGTTAKGVWGTSNAGTGVYGLCNSAQTSDSGGVLGRNTALNGNGVIGEANTGIDAYGVWGRSNEGYGVYGSAPWAVVGQGSIFGVFSYGRMGGNSDLYVSGDVGAGGSKPFRIDHPDDPENRYLFHYATESPEIINFYSGKVILNDAGEAVVGLPQYFAKINKDARYMLTAVGDPMPMLHIAQEIDETTLTAAAAAAPEQAAPVCSFRIAGGAPRGKVSWRVEAVRNDPYVRAHGAPVESLKPETERGTYTHPELYGKPEELAVHYRPRTQDAETLKAGATHPTDKHAD
jgi:hypothetical protein